MSGIFGKLSRRFGNDAEDDASMGTNGGSDDGRERLSASFRKLSDEYDAAIRRTNDPIILSALTQALKVMQSQTESELESGASDSEMGRLAGMYDDASNVIHAIRVPIEEGEERIPSSRYETNVDADSLHETKTVRNTDELMYALEDLFRNIHDDGPADVVAVMTDENGMPRVDDLMIDWGDAGDGRTTVVFGPSSLLPLSDSASDGDGDNESGLALVQPDEIGHTVTDDDLNGMNVEDVIALVEAIRHDDVDTIIEASRDTPDLYRVACIADGYMVGWYDDESERPSLKKAVLKAISDDASGHHEPSGEFMSTVMGKLDGESL